jgi:hypothetical protein
MNFGSPPFILKAARQVNNGRIPRMGQGPGKLDLFLM